MSWGDFEHINDTVGITNFPIKVDLCRVYSTQFPDSGTLPTNIANLPECPLENTLTVEAQLMDDYGISLTNSTVHIKVGTGSFEPHTLYGNATGPLPINVPAGSPIRVKFDDLPGLTEEQKTDLSFVVQQVTGTISTTIAVPVEPEYYVYSMTTVETDGGYLVPAPAIDTANNVYMSFNVGICMNGSGTAFHASTPVEPLTGSTLAFVMLFTGGALGIFGFTLRKSDQRGAKMACLLVAGTLLIGAFMAWGDGSSASPVSAQGGEGFAPEGIQSCDMFMQPQGTPTPAPNPISVTWELPKTAINRQVFNSNGLKTEIDPSYSETFVNIDTRRPIPQRDALEFTFDIEDTTNVSRVYFMWDTPQGIEAEPQYLITGIFRTNDPGLATGGSTCQQGYYSKQGVGTGYHADCKAYVIPTLNNRGFIVWDLDDTNTSFEDFHRYRVILVARRSGVLPINVAVVLKNGTVQSFPLQTFLGHQLEIPVTLIDFSDERIQSLMFWVLFNETNIGKFENNRFNTINSNFLTQPNYCVSGSTHLGQNEQPNEPPNVSWQEGVEYIYHCSPPKPDGLEEEIPFTRDFAYLNAQTIINGFISQERKQRNSNSYDEDEFIEYVLSDFSSSIGNGGYYLWTTTFAPLVGYFSSTGNTTFIADIRCDSLAGKYATLVMDNSYDDILSWLHHYLQCLTKEEQDPTFINNKGYEIISEAYARFLPQIQTALTDFAFDPYYDATNAAFNLRSAASESQGGSFGVCVGGCPGGSYPYPPRSDTGLNVSDTQSQEAYAQLIINLTGYTPEDEENPEDHTVLPKPTMLRPVLILEWSEETNEAGVALSRTYVGYKWGAIAYQQSRYNSDYNPR